MIENVGNLVCPAEFRVGEDTRVMVSSVTEGEDKPAKYPLMFRACELVLINKIDLLEHLDFDLELFLYRLDAVHPGVEQMQLSAKTGAGTDAFRDWLAAVAATLLRPRPRAGRWRRRRPAPPAASASWWRSAAPPIATTSRPRRMRWHGSATGWPSASRAAGGWSPSASRRARALTFATSLSSSSTR